jgi:hypothetical protein
MRRKAVLLLAVGAATLRPGAGLSETLGEALKSADPHMDWRVRYEGVEQNGFASDADALTSRVRAGLTTGSVKDTKLLAEAVWVADVVDDYDSTTNGHSQYPVVADPSGFAAINRFAFINDSLADTTLTLGRQRIALDDHRFVGNVGWRQHEQTYDGLRAEHRVGAWRADLSYVSQVNRVFGPESPIGAWHGDIVLGNVSRKAEWGTLTFFDYSIDLDEAAALSTNTLGVRLSGSKALGSTTASYTASAARQSDTGQNAADFAENYYFIEGALTIAKFTFGVGVEQLGSDGTNAVTTPLATLHAFQGWSDKFLATPGAGIDERFAKIAYKGAAAGPFLSFDVQAVWHDFDADAGAAHFGSELDLQFVASTERAVFTLKYAAYDADELLTDTDKLWVAIDYAF